MNDIVSHLKYLENKLETIGISKRGKFAAWCVNKLSSDIKIRDNISMLTGSEVAINLIDESINFSWDFVNDNNTAYKLKKKIDSIIWNEESEIVNDEMTLGSIELLGAVSNMLAGLVEDNVSMQANCAERVINWLDYLNDFELIDSDKVINEEYNIQVKFISDIMNDNFLFINKYRVSAE